MANNNFNYRLTISEQLDLLYSENDNLKMYLNQTTIEKEKLVNQYEEKICCLEYKLDMKNQEFIKNSNFYEHQIKTLNDEIISYQAALTTQHSDKQILIGDYKKLEEKYRVANEYINVLPTPQESDKLTKNLNRLKNEVDKYRNQLQESQIIIKRLENDIADKNIELANFNDREVIMKSQMDLLSEKMSRMKCLPMVKEEKVSDWNFTPDLFDDMKMSIDKYKNELINYKQFWESDKNKYNTKIKNYQAKIDDLQLQLEFESNTISTLRKENEINKMKFINLEKRLKDMIQEKQNIMGNMMDLEKEIERIDQYGCDGVQQLYLTLLTEIFECSKEIDTVTQCFYKLINKEQVDVTMLINCAELNNLTLEKSCSNLLEKEFLHNQLSSVRQSRLRLSEIKNLLMQQCTDNMAADVKFCLTQ